MNNLGTDPALGEKQNSWWQEYLRPPFAHQYYRHNPCSKIPKIDLILQIPL